MKCIDCGEEDETKFEPRDVKAFQMVGERFGLRRRCKACLEKARAKNAEHKPKGRREGMANPAQVLKTIMATHTLINNEGAEVVEREFATGTHTDQTGRKWTVSIRYSQSASEPK